MFCFFEGQNVGILIKKEKTMKKDVTAVMLPTIISYLPTIEIEIKILWHEWRCDILVRYKTNRVYGCQRFTKQWSKSAKSNLVLDEWRTHQAFSWKWTCAPMYMNFFVCFWPYINLLTVMYTISTYDTCTNYEVQWQQP